jgi:hypothetical protein
VAPLTPTPAQRYKASPTPPTKSGRATSMLEREPLPIPPERRGPPSETKMWLVNVVAFLVVSVLTLLFFYYTVAWFSKAGNFLNLPLPGLPAKKAPAAQKTVMEFAPIRGAAAQLLPLPLGEDQPAVSSTLRLRPEGSLSNGDEGRLPASSPTYTPSDKSAG